MGEVERAGEEERRSLQQELTRVKQEVVSIMKVRNEPLLDVVCFFFFLISKYVLEMFCIMNEL